MGRGRVCVGGRAAAWGVKQGRRAHVRAHAWENGRPTHPCAHGCCAGRGVQQRNLPKAGPGAQPQHGAPALLHVCGALGDDVEKIALSPLLHNRRAIRKRALLHRAREFIQHVLGQPRKEGLLAQRSGYRGGNGHRRRARGGSGDVRCLGEHVAVAALLKVDESLVRKARLRLGGGGKCGAEERRKVGSGRACRCAADGSKQVLLDIGVVGKRAP